MIISHKYKFLFFCPVGNCATTSIYKALLPLHDEKKVERIYEFNFEHPLNKNPDGISDPKEGIFNDSLIVSKHIPPSRFFSFNRFKEEHFKDYIKFCVVRNPWDWCLAVFLKSALDCGNKNFKDKFNFNDDLIDVTLGLILRGKNFNKTQYDTVSNEKGETYITDFLKFENLDHDFKQILEKTGLPPIGLGHEQNNKNNVQKNYQDYYSDKSQKIIERQFKKDIEKFNYNF